MFAFILYPERDKSLLRRHPWVFSKAVASIVALDAASADQENVELKLCKPAPKKDIAAGTLCQIRDHQGKFLCYAHYSPYSQIMLRAISFKLGERIDYDFFKQRLAAASAKRIPLQKAGNDGVRLVAAEGDYLPGLIVDRYDKVISLAITSWGMEANYEHLIVALHELFPECYLYERSDGKARSKEHLPQRVGLIDFMQPSAQDNLQDELGKALPNSRQVKSVPRLRAPQIAADAAIDGEQISLTEAIPDTLYVKESNLVSIPIDVMQGHKTGGYLDQRQSRLHTYHLCREFKRFTMCNFVEYVNKIRVLHAQRLFVESDKTITQIAMDVGFGSLTHFERVFFQHTGQKPKKMCTFMREQRDHNGIKSLRVPPLPLSEAPVTADVRALNRDSATLVV